MYWKDETRKSAVFSKLTMSSSSGSIIGGMYLDQIVSRSRTQREKERSPRLCSNMEEGDDLKSTGDGDLTDERREDLLRDEVGGRSFRMNSRESFRSSHYRKSSVKFRECEMVRRTGDGNWEDEEEIDVKELEISESSSNRVEQRDGGELNERVECPASRRISRVRTRSSENAHELEATETRHQSSPTFPARQIDQLTPRVKESDRLT